MHNPSLAPTGAATDTTPAWRTFAGERVVVYAAAGTHGAKRAPAVAKLADRAVEALERLLTPRAGAAWRIGSHLSGRPDRGSAG